MKKIWILMVIAACFTLVISACGNAEEKDKETNETGGTPKPIEAALNVPADAEVEETVNFETKVTQGEETVDDADEVKYEVWKEGAKEESEMIEAKAEGGGVYKADKKFANDGVYLVQVHVTARGLHTMPKAEITVGTPDKSEPAVESEEEQSYTDSH